MKKVRTYFEAPDHPEDKYERQYQRDFRFASIGVVISGDLMIALILGLALQSLAGLAFALGLVAFLVFGVALALKVADLGDRWGAKKARKNHRD